MASPLSFGQFGGAASFADPIELPMQVATSTVNQRPGRQDLQPWRTALPVANTPSAGRKTIYRMGYDVRADGFYWLSWDNVVHAIRGFEQDDTTERTYFTGDGVPKWTNNIMALAGGAYPAVSRLLGIPAPISAPIATLNTDGTGTEAAAEWIYVSTFVNDIGWESAPSPASGVVVAKQGAVVDISQLEPIPTGQYGINRRRIYKLITTAAGVGEFFFLAEVAINVTSLQDTGFVGSDTLATEGWLPPPADSRCITQLWGGIMAVISGKSVRMSLPYKPYAYKLSGEMDFTDSLVGMVTVGQQLFVLSNNDVYVASGSDPETITAQPMKLFQPCSSDRGYVGFEDGFVWVTPNGLCWYGAGGFKNLTQGIFTREQWQQYVPTSMVLARYLSMVFVFYQVGGVWRGMVYDFGDPGGVYFLDAGYSAAFRDGISDSLFVLDPRNVGTAICKFDAGPTLMSATWVSKVVRHPRIATYAAYQIVARNYPVQVKVLADGIVIENTTVQDDRPVRLPSGLQARDWQFSLGTAVGSIQLARFAVAAMDLREP
jgi:hypothetical protein